MKLRLQKSMLLALLTLIKLSRLRKLLSRILLGGIWRLRTGESWCSSWRDWWRRTRRRLLQLRRGIMVCSLSPSEGRWHGEGLRDWSPEDLDLSSQVLASEFFGLYVLIMILTGKPYSVALNEDLGEVAGTIKYYAGWADKITGQVIDTSPAKLAYTIREPIGVCGQIIPFVLYQSSHSIIHTNYATRTDGITP